MSEQELVKNNNTQNNKKQENEIFEKPQPAHIGANANRSCTNFCALILFIAVWIGFIAFSGVAFANGDIYRLVNGVDYLGNVCGRGTPKNVTAAAAANWADRQFLYYPIGFNPKTGAFQISGAKDLGICVVQCPGAGESRETYSENPPPSLPLSYKSWFATTPKFHRCVPAFDCAKALDDNTTDGTTTTTTTVTTVTGGTTEISPLDRCRQQSGEASGVFNQLAGFGDVALQGFAEVKARWWVIVVCALITIILSFLWMFVLNRAVKPVVSISILLVLVVVGLACGLCLREYMRIKDTVAPDTHQMNMYLGIGIGAGILEFLLLCIIIYLRSDIMIACDIIEEAAQIPLAIKTMIAVPPVLVIIMLGMTIYFLFVAANIYTASEVISLNNVPTLTTDGTYNGTGVDLKTQQFANWRPAGFAFTIFQFLWTYGFLNAVGYSIIAFCAVFWYWSKPGSPKAPEHGVAKATFLTLRYHLGTLALGSLIVAVIQAIRIMLQLLEKRLRAASNNSQGVRCIIACAQCCLGCFESIIKFINRNAYIVQAMTGEPFMTAARHALSLLASNVFAVMLFSLVSEYVILLSKIILTAISLGIGYGILQSMADFSSAGVIFMLVFIGIVCYFVATVFLGIFHICIDTVMISYCYDLEQNNGQGRPYFFPEDLAKHLDTAKARVAAKQEADQKKQFEATADYKQVDK